MFKTIVVALDLESKGDQALPVVRALSTLGPVEIELLTVSSPNMPDDVDAFELSGRALDNGWAPHSYVVIHGDDVARAIADHLEGRDDVLLVMATSARRPVVGHFLGSVTEHVLRIVDRPVLLVGPRVPAAFEWHAPTPIVCVDESDAAVAAIPTIASWMDTFRSSPPLVAEVTPTAATGDASTDAREASHVRHVAEVMAAHGVAASPKVLHGGDPAAWLTEFADHVVEPVFVTTSARWTDGRPHWHSATRQLVQQSSHPVLVVPVPRHEGVSGRRGS